ncbi:tryptophan 7-halogenase [Streptomyces sp. L2]|uniref:tryptophan 7-halogenase n=1 Tax=Streptomyces sp. L2 TaxID=2162665 RepID=UPI0013E97A82|nr:tryptophan 7-halogenase [Streptomyces sp. L2]
MTESGTGLDSGRMERVLASLAPDDAAAVRAWLGKGGRQIDDAALVADHEPVDLGRRPSSDDPQAIRRVGVIGGGTAGYLTALALQAKRPWLQVELVESRDIPIIGVGEATVPYLLWFLHQLVGIDMAEFYERVRPAWKLGIKFDWGADPDGFTAPFGWGQHSIGMLGALREHGGIDPFNLTSLLMQNDVTPVLNVGKEPVSLLKHLPFAYHLDNSGFVGYLRELAERRGIQHVDATVTDVVLDSRGWVDRLRTVDGRDLSYDLYVDCTGFRSKLLGEGLGVPYESYAGSLFTDSAITAERDHRGHLKPYTTATTMNSGWCWTIPVPDCDHMGYVYSSASMSDDEAAAELTRRYPGVTGLKQLRFKSGRRSEVWRNNVIAVGNSYGFVEPLESSALHMMTVTVQTLLSTLPESWARPNAQAMVNTYLARKWDSLRWFLAIHYRFNTRLDTPFWKEARELTDVSGWQPLLDLFADGAPLARREESVKQLILDAAPTPFGIGGVDTLLLGQQVPARLLPATEPPEHWDARRRAAETLTRHALPQHDALQVVSSHPEMLSELLQDDDSWAGPRAMPPGDMSVGIN